jgi:hypothetical protein
MCKPFRDDPLRSEAEIASVTSKYATWRVLGASGTTIAFDTRGFHRAAPFHSGSRLVLSMDWMRASE